MKILLSSTRSIILVAAVLVPAAEAQDYLGAKAVLQQVATRSADQTQKPTNGTAVLRADLRVFRQTATNLAPADAAKQWLDFVDRARRLQQQYQFNYSSMDRPLQANEVFAALPPPPAWKALSNAIAARPPAKKGEQIRESGLRFLAATLNGDAEGQKREIDWLQAKGKDASVQMAYTYKELAQQWDDATLAMSDDPAVVMKMLEHQLISPGQNRWSSSSTPNLVSEVGPEKAEAFLRKALVAPGYRLEFQQPNDTSRLAQKLALEMIDQLKAPQWGLINSLDSVDLYEAFEKKFNNETNQPVAGNNEPSGFEDMQEKPRAQMYYMLGLIARNRPKEAATFARKLSSPNQEYMFQSALREMEQAGYSTVLDDFFHELLSQDPSLSFWKQYMAVSAATGRTDRMLQLLRAAGTRDDLTDEKKTAIQQILFEALLTDNQTDLAVAEIKRLATATTNPPETIEYCVGNLGVRLARIGLLESNAAWTAEGIMIAKNWLATKPTQDNHQDPAIVAESLANILLDQHRGPEAEALLADALAKSSTQSSAFQTWSHYESQGLLTSLATVYFRAGRTTDVLSLLDESPDWGAKDLSEFFGRCGRSSELPLPYVAAKSLLVAGETARARKVMDELLLREPGDDRGYELLLELDGTNAIPRLDQLFARDPFEERPLIWKAHLLKQQKRLDEAEKIVRQAIAIDPSDGDEGKGDRMRAYSELADILEAKGNKKDADTYREIVKAIRLSEQADDFYYAGLLKPAIAMYEKALGHFSDAYCIQSRLAIQLSALGQTAAAEEHYRRAYELMPDSFGRVESHCFGCERAFEGERAQSIAEKVFTKIVAERPGKPQAHYLLGYLRMEQERYKESYSNFVDAVRLDPDYLNAWKKMQDVSDQILMPAKARDEIVFNILRLDPTQQHGSIQFTHVTDLVGLWNAVAIAQSHRTPESTDVLTLAASKAAMEAKAKSMNNSGYDIGMGTDDFMPSYRNQTPATAVAQTPFVSMAGEWIMGFNGNTED